MDTISLFQAGFENVVASMGTSLTKEQARLVKRYSDNVLISYDGDFAGQKADLRGLEILKDEALNVRVVPMPEGLDPDDVVKQGADAYQKCLDAAMPLIDYKIHAVERKYDLSRSEEKRKFVAEALKVVSEADSESVKEELLRKLRDQTGISYHALERDLEGAKKAPPEKQAPQVQEQTRIAETASGTDRRVKAVRFILAAKLFSAPYANGYKMENLSLTDATHKEIAAYIAERESLGERMRASELFEVLDEDSAEFNAILDLNYEDKLSGENAERFFGDCVKTLERETIEREIANLNEELNAETDVEKRKAIMKKIAMNAIKSNQLKK